MQRDIHGLRDGAFRHLFRSRKTTLQMISDTFRGQYRMSVLTRAILVLAVAYIISPIDLIPDHYFLVGWVDDIAILLLGFRRLQFETHRYIRFKAAERRKGGAN